MTGRAALIAIAILVSCKAPESPREGKQPVAKEKPIDFNGAYKQFITAVYRADTAAFNRYIHPEKGLYIIEHTPIGPSATGIFDIGEFFRRSDSKPFFEFNREELSLEIKNEPLPVPDCPNYPRHWLREGTFVAEKNLLKEQSLTENLIATEPEKKRIEALLQTIDVTVLNTHNYTWYFSMIGMEWFVTFIDIREVCPDKRD
jgi:hypothetical protein